MKKKFHAAVRDGKTRGKEDGSMLRARSFGVKIGYWPCFRAPFIEIAWNTKRYAMWYGYSGYDEATAAGVFGDAGRYGPPCETGCDLRIAA